MSLFGFGKKKEEKEIPACCCGSTGQAEESACCCAADSSVSNIRVLGAGCKSCHEQYENAMAAVRAMGLNLEVEYITDMERVMEYGVMSMPALVVNETVATMGKVLDKEAIKSYLV